MDPVDLRSDTITKPTPPMRAAMAQAPVGDDVFGEDPTVNRLEAKVAELLGMEAALFAPSGTMTNEIAVGVHAPRGTSIILEADSHIRHYECGGPAALWGVSVDPVAGVGGVITAQQVDEAIRAGDIHYAKTALVCLENTHNRAGGTVFPIEVIEEISALCRARGLKLHLDGARLFNASVASGIGVSEYARPFDSVSVCLSKGLGAPVGSVLSGSAGFIAEARTLRKLLGGGMRQAGILAAAGLYALEHHIDRMAQDHENARLLAEGIAGLPGIHIEMKSVQTNIVRMEVDAAHGPASDAAARLKANGVLVGAFGKSQLRAVTHLDVDSQDIRRATEAFGAVFGKGND